MLRVVVLSYESHQSCAIINDLLDRRVFEPVALVRSTVVDPRRPGIKLVTFLLAPNRAWGVSWKTAEVLLSRFGHGVHRMVGRRSLSLRSLARTHDTQCIDCADPTDPTFLQQLNDLKPDLLLSVHFNHVLKPITWNVATLGAINVHGGLLPNHRGLFPHFYALAAGDSVGGVTVHWVDERLDTGRPIAQLSIPIHSDDTVVRLENRAIPTSAQAIAEAIKLIEELGAGAELVPAPRGVTSYHSWPTNDDMRRLRKAGHKYLDGSDIKELLRAPRVSAPIGSPQPTSVLPSPK